jgi:hypothetical protein
LTAALKKKCNPKFIFQFFPRKQCDTTKLFITASKQIWIQNKTSFIQVSGMFHSVGDIWNSRKKSLYQTKCRLGITKIKKPTKSTIHIADKNVMMAKGFS